MEPFLGQIQPFGFNFPPRGWAFCDGQLLPIAQNTALFALLGTTYGGDGRTTFALPDLRGRSIVHVGRGPGLSFIPWGQRAGDEFVILTETQLPAHTHFATTTPTASATATATLHGETAAADSKNPQNRMLALTAENTYAASVAANDKTMAAESINVTVDSVNVNVAVVNQSTGGSQPFSLRNPYLGIYVNIALVGTFPSRN